MRSNGLLNPHTLHCLIKAEGLFNAMDGRVKKLQRVGTMKTRVCLSVYRAKAVGPYTQTSLLTRSVLIFTVAGICRAGPPS